MTDPRPDDAADTSDREDTQLSGNPGGTQDYSLPGDDDPANQDAQANADLVHQAQGDLDDLPVSGDVTGGHVGEGGSDALAGAGAVYDDGIDPSIRTEMLDNAVAYGDDFAPSNVNDEPGFDDGVPGSFSEFSVITPENPEGTTRLADPSLDAGGRVRGPRIGGSGGMDGGPPREHPLPGTEEEDGA